MSWGRDVTVAVLVVGGVLAGCSVFGADNDAPAEQAPDSAAGDDGPEEASSGMSDAAAGSDALDAADALDAKTNCSLPTDGGCSDGGCESRCPAIGNFAGDSMRFEGVGVKQRIRSLVDCNLFECAVSNGSVGCENPGLGHVGKVCASNMSAGCPVGGSIDLSLGNADNCGKVDCTYRCTRLGGSQ